MQPTKMLPKLTEDTQTISFSDGDGVSSSEVFATDVVVSTNAGNHDHGSSKVKLTNLVDYNWEPKFYHGQLLAIHLSGNYLAYSIKAPNNVNPGSWTGMVRVVHNPNQPTDKRALIKGMKGEIQDLAFAHIQNQVIIAIIDDQGNFYVHEIKVTDNGLRTTLLAEVRDDYGMPSVGHRVVWCPYIPDEGEEAPDEDVAKLLLTTHGNIARIWNMRVIVAECAGSECVGRARALAAGAGVRVAAEHDARVVAAAFSPDGTALATAAADGYVMFFQVYMDDDSSPRCLHKWQPHDGKPLSCLFFLDNHNNYNTDVQFWKFAVTGAENNTIIKVWSCKSWACLQTVTFTPHLATEGLGLKAMLDRSATYLLLSDFKTRSLYVLNMARDADDSMAYCKSISEFLLPYPVLSFCIVDAEEQIVKCESSCDDPFHRNGSAGDGVASPDDFELHHNENGSAVSCSYESGRRVCVKLYIVQPKGLQEGSLVYTPPAPPAPPALHEQLLHDMSSIVLENSSPSEESALASSILQQQTQQLKNLLLRAQPQGGGLMGARQESPPSAPQLNLMTPDAFSSPGKREEDDTPLAAVSPDIAIKSRNSSLAIGDVGSALKLTSGGSSPSREVQEIMSHNEDEFYKDHLDEALICEEPVLEPKPVPPPMPNGAEPLFTDDIIFSESSIVSHKITHTTSETTWPQISLEQITEANQRKATSDKCNSSLNTCNALATPIEEARVERARVDKLEQKIDRLTDLLEQQTLEIRSLREAAQSPRAMLDQALHQHTLSTAQAIETALQAGWERIGRVGEMASKHAATAAGMGASHALEPLVAALQSELATKLTATDHLLRDNIHKLANSKTVMERLSTSIAKSVSEMVKDSFRSALLESVVPVMEKTHQIMFRQVNQAFHNGTKEFVAHTEAAARAAAERGGTAATASLRAALDRHAEALTQAAQTPPMHHLTAALSAAAHSVLEKEMAWWREQARNVAVQMSRAHSPSTPSVADRQMQVAQIQSLLSAGDVNGAFQLALNASDLALVMCACRAAEPALVFGPPCQLKQHVLLSLVQQLAADMPRDTLLKHRYLEEAVMNLDTSNPLTREHLPAVVRELQKQILAFLQSHPSHTLARQFRMLLMAADSLVKGAA